MRALVSNHGWAYRTPLGRCGAPPLAPLAGVTPARPALGPRARAWTHPARAQRGAVAVLMTAALVLMLAMCVLAVDAGMIHARQHQLDLAAQSVALAAAARLDGTADGVRRALDAAEAAAVQATYGIGAGQSVGWSPDGLSFSKSPPPHADWMSGAGAISAPQGVYYTRVDVARLAPQASALGPLSAQLLVPRLRSIDLASVAMAGRVSTEVVPLALCALSQQRASARVNPGPPRLTELVEWGFRRGVNYNLMMLNGAGTTPEHFLIDPVTALDRPGKAVHTSVAMVAPYACSGTVGLPAVGGGALSLRRPFPIDQLYRHLNTRFAQYDGAPCKRVMAPADNYLEQYGAGSAWVDWMSPAPVRQAAKPHIDGNRLVTVADPLVVPAGVSAQDYGVLWAASGAAAYGSYRSGIAEPENGYAGFGASQWPSLYPHGPHKLRGSVLRPYHLMPVTWHQHPQGESAFFVQQYRRVLHVPLLACPVPAGVLTSGRVLGIGKFVMTVPATATALYGEFAGVVEESELAGRVELL